MIEGRPDPAAPALSPDDSSTFGFDRPADEWFDRVRHAARRVSLGRIGDYDLLEVAGHGGQGVVYRARQGSTGREVALKRLLTGSWAGEDSRARFAREVRVDAALRHPNIVTLYAADVVDEQPLLAMEWVDGVAIDRWAAEGSRGVPEVLRTFLKVCAGVQHAHQRGVIHRDLKPSNILVDASGEPRVLDFGLAKQTDDEDRSRLTMSGGFIGTLAYCAPEQVRADAAGVDVRTDVYALGSILYQCLTGRAPFPGGGDLAALTRGICETDPARPSSIRRGLDRDLDAIALKAMAKEKDRRYQSVDALAADVHRHLDREPVEARRHARLYVLGRQLRRHKLAAAVALGYVVVVTCGLAGVGAFWQRAERQARDALSQRDRSERVAAFMAETLSGVGPGMAQGQDTRLLKQLMDTAARRIKTGELREAPEAEVTLRLAIGDVYRDLAEFDDAAAMLEPALAMTGITTGAPGATAVEAAKETEQAALSLRAWGYYLLDTGRAEEAERFHERALQMRRRLHRGDHPEIASSLNELAHVREIVGRAPEAERLYMEALEMRRRLYPGDHPYVAQSLNNLGYFLDTLGRPAEAEPLLEQALEMNRQLHPGDDTDVATNLINLGNIRASLGRPAEAEPLLEQALEMRRHLYPGDHPEVATSLNDLGICLDTLGRETEAEALHREALAIRRRFFPGDHWAVLASLHNLASVLVDLGHGAEAVPLFEQALEMCRRLYPGAHPHTAVTLHHLADELRKQKQFASAEPLARESLAAYREHPDWSARERRHASQVLAAVLSDDGRWDEGAVILRDELASVRLRNPGDDTDLASALGVFGLHLVKTGTPEAAAEAAPLLRECLQIRDRVASDHWLRFNTMSVLGGALACQAAALRDSDPDRAAALFGEAEALLLDGYAGMMDKPDALSVRVREAVERLVALYGAWGKPDKAEEYRARLATVAPTPPPPAP